MSWWTRSRGGGPLPRASCFRTAARGHGGPRVARSPPAGSAARRGGRAFGRANQQPPELPSAAPGMTSWRAKSGHCGNRDSSFCRRRSPARVSLGAARSTPPPATRRSMRRPSASRVTGPKWRDASFLACSGTRSRARGRRRCRHILGRQSRRFRERRERLPDAQSCS